MEENLLKEYQTDALKFMLKVSESLNGIAEGCNQKCSNLSDLLNF